LHNEEFQPELMIQKLNLGDPTPNMHEKCFMSVYFTYINKFNEFRGIRKALQNLVILHAISYYYFNQINVTELSKDNLEIIINNFNKFYPRENPRASANDRIGSKQLFRYYIRYLLCLAKHFNDEDKVLMIHDEIQNILNKSGYSFYKIYLEESLRARVLFWPTESSDAAEKCRQFLTDGLTKHNKVKSFYNDIEATKQKINAYENNENEMGFLDSLIS